MRETYFQKVKRIARRDSIIGFSILLLGIVLRLIGIKINMIIVTIIGFAVIVFGFLLLILGLDRLINPTKVIKKMSSKDPYLIAKIDELENNIIYEDDVFIMSNRYIATKKHMEYLFGYEELFWVYVSKDVTNLSSIINFCCAKFDFILNVSNFSEYEINAIINLLVRVCPNVKVGYTVEAKNHYKYMKKIFKEGSYNNYG